MYQRLVCSTLVHQELHITKMAFINHKEMWDSQVEDCYFVDDVGFDGSGSQSIESSQSENVSYSCDGEHTPVKGMMERANFAENIKNKNKRQKQCEPWSQSKRRRLLQFDSEVLDGLLCTDESNSSILTASNEAGDSVNEVLSQMSHWLSEDPDGTSLPCKEVLDQSFEGWLSSCLTDAEMEFNNDNMDSSGPSHVPNNANVGTQNLGHGLDSTTVAERPILIRHNSDLTGYLSKKSFMQTPDSSPASVIYPFTFLKPSGFSGDMTLKDINQIIHAPPKLQEDPIYSAFSGKPVVAKTKLCTGGGKGSITIMRTKG